MDENVWERARLIPVSGITGPDEQERRGSSALLAVIESVKEFGRSLAAPLGAPAGAITTYIEVPFKLGEKHLRPDGVIRVVRGSKSWTALVEVKTGRNELRAAQIESYLDLARQEGFEAVLTISNQLVTAAGEHPVAVDGRKTRKVSLHHLSWSQVYTEALIEQGNRSVADPDQAWILAEFVRYLGHPRSGAVDFDDMGPLWVAVRDAARAGTLTQNDKGTAEVTNRFGQLISFAAMGLSRQLGVQVTPALSPADAKDPDRRLKPAVVTFTRQAACTVRYPYRTLLPRSRSPLTCGPGKCAARSRSWHPKQANHQQGSAGSPASSGMPPVTYASSPSRHTSAARDRRRASPRCGRIRKCWWMTRSGNCALSPCRWLPTSGPNAARAKDHSSARSSAPSTASTPRSSSTSSHGPRPRRKSRTTNHPRPIRPWQNRWRCPRPTTSK